jgi:hypothetical protein
MDASAAVKIVCFYILVAASETLNGVARTVFLNKRFGIRNAKRFSMISALFLCLLICYYYIPLLTITTDKGLLLLGISLSMFMLGFDIVLARFVVKARWDMILDDFDIRKGNLLAIGMIAMAFCPLLSQKMALIR